MLEFAVETTGSTTMSHGNAALPARSFVVRLRHRYIANDT